MSLTVLNQTGILTTDNALSIRRMLDMATSDDFRKLKLFYDKAFKPIEDRQYRTDFQLWVNNERILAVWEL